jgi:hypothetical protein
MKDIEIINQETMTAADTPKEKLAHFRFLLDCINQIGTDAINHGTEFEGETALDLIDVVTEHLRGNFAEGHTLFMGE